MDKYALFVDAGYLLAAGQWACTGTFRRRSEYDADLPALAAALRKQAEETLPDKRLLRIYWYDAAPARVPTADHLRVASEDQVMLRMGNLTTRGEQKGVDALLILELYDHGRDRIISDAVVVAGDADLVEGVTRAQRFGVEVSVWAFKTPQSTLSPELRRAADHTRMLPTGPFADAFEATGRAEASLAVSARPTHTGSAPESLPAQMAVFPSTAANLEPARQAAASFANRLFMRASSDEIASVLKDRPMIPRAVDAELIRATIEGIGSGPETILSVELVYAMREEFLKALDRLQTG